MQICNFTRIFGMCFPAIDKKNYSSSYYIYIIIYICTYISERGLNRFGVGKKSLKNVKQIGFLPLPRVPGKKNFLIIFNVTIVLCTEAQPVEALGHLQFVAGSPAMSKWFTTTSVDWSASLEFYQIHRPVRWNWENYSCYWLHLKQRGAQEPTENQMSNKHLCFSCFFGASFSISMSLLQSCQIWWDSLKTSHDSLLEHTWNILRTVAI